MLLSEFDFGQGFFDEKKGKLGVDFCIKSRYVNQVPTNVKVFLNANDKVPLDLGCYILEKFRDAAIIEFNAFLGDAKIAARVVMYKAPQEIANKRMREANKRAKDTGRTLSKGKKTLTMYSAFVTNVLSKILPAELIGTIYRLRWEIELIFKQWKSQLRIHHLQGINPNRVDTLIWGRLCMVVVCAMGCAWFKKFADEHAKIELSTVKLINYFIRGNGFIKAVASNQIEKFFKQVEQDIPRMLAKNKRQRKTMREKVNTAESYYGVVACF